VTALTPGPARPRLRAVAVTAALALLGAALLVPPASAQSSARTGAALDVLVLGDSYSAGNGATDESGDPRTFGPADCYRSSVAWGEKYAATLRAGGQPVDLANHACSGGVSADISAPRAMDTSTRVTATPAGVTNAAQAETALTRSDPCDTGRFPDEEFWTYRATLVVPGALTTYDCTRMLRPQADFVTPDTDLVLFTMGGNDAGFTTIVTSCFVPVVRTAAACRTAVEAARALLPTLQQRLIGSIAALRARGLRDDARIVQLGYPWLQADNGFTLTDVTGTYDAGAQVRSLVTQGNAAIAAIVPTANAGHPDQLSFLAGVPEKFAGHEPDATTVVGNPARWLLQVGDGTTVSFWYHPNRLGQTAYAELLGARGTFGATAGSSAPAAVSASMKVRLKPRRLSGPPRRDDRIRVRVKISLSDGTRPRGRLVVRALPGRARLAAPKVRAKARGTVRATLRLRDPRIRKVRISYVDRSGATVTVTKVVRARR
jgi:lysophospholipase L1-like esterase